MPHEYKPGETVDGTQEGPIIHGLESGASGTVRALNLDASGNLASMPLPSGIATEAKQDTQETSLNAIQAAVESIKDTDGIKKITNALPAGTNNIGDVDVLTQPARDRTTDNVGAALQTDALMNDTTVLTPKYAVIDNAVSGDNTIIAAVAGKKIRVLSYVFVAAGTVTVRFEDGAGGTALTGQMTCYAGTGVASTFNPVGHFETTANTLLNMELSAAVSVDGHVCYVEI